MVVNLLCEWTVCYTDNLPT